MKTCPHCSKTLPFDCFYLARPKKDGTPTYGTYCKRCQYTKNRNRLQVPEKRRKYLQYQSEYQRSKGRENRHRRFAWLDKAKDVPCLDCGGRFPPECMDFDHRDPSVKLFDVSGAVVSGRSVLSVQKEIAKCDVVCANCHRIRTAIQHKRHQASTSTFNAVRNFKITD